MVRKILILIFFLSILITSLALSFCFLRADILPKKLNEKAALLYFSNSNFLSESLYNFSENNYFFQKYLRESNKLSGFVVSNKNTILEEILPYEIQSSVNDNLSDEQSIRMLGENGKQFRQKKFLTIDSSEYSDEKIISDIIISKVFQKPEIVIAGKKEENLVEKDILKKLQPFLNSVQSVQLDFIKDEVIVSNYDDYQVKAGTITVRVEACKLFANIDLYFNFRTSEYTFDLSEAGRLDGVACDSTINVEQIEVLLCANCYLERVDKTRKLPANYIPNSISSNIDGISYDIDSKVEPDLRELLKAAKEAGLNIFVTSSYRSYETQIKTFENWILWNQNVFGYDRARAEAEANKISARAGFSEHQLGTTVDLNAKECEAFEGFCEYNDALWKWLKINAPEYGFILSYPEGSESITGYTFEPWHYRWIGKENAKKFLDSGKTLNIWLGELNFSN